MRLRALISKRNPFLPSLPDDRISLCVYADETGFRYWNRSSDPMPIKTINMNGLQKWEETDDYIIYLDKDAVMTTVAQYVTGTYDLFLERKADIDGAMELLKINDIEWTAEDDSKLILDINKAQLERIANTPTTMEEEDFTPQTFTTRAVPTTYEACFRVDKKTGEIYICEGYENLAKTITGFRGYEVTKGSNGEFETTFTAIEGESRKPFSQVYFSAKANNIISSTYLIRDNLLHNPYSNTWSEGGSIGFNNTITLSQDISYLQIISSSIPTKQISDCLYQITKTSTPKPFVKSIMPNGKLAFVTGATSETHSFVGKNVELGNNIYNNSGRFISFDGDYPYEVNENSIPLKTILISDSYKNCTKASNYPGVKGCVFLGVTPTKPATKDLFSPTFKQLLIYKGNLTEAELKAENEKDIRLK